MQDIHCLVLRKHLVIVKVLSKYCDQAREKKLAKEKLKDSVVDKNEVTLDGV